MFTNSAYKIAMLWLMFSSNANGQTNPSNKEIEGFNAELLIDVEGDTISGYALIAKGSKKKQTVVIIKGYPGNDSNFDLAQELRNQGLNAILFNHRGAWGSQGKYLYSNCLEDIEYLINYLAEPNVSENLRIDINNFVLIGRSLGGGVALISGCQINRVKKIIGISNVNYGELMQNYSDVNELNNYSKYMKKQIMMNHNINEFLEELIENKAKYSIANYSEELSKKKVLLLEDSRKNDKWIEDLINYEIQYLISDHNFTDQRNNLINYVISWLRKTEHNMH